MVKLHETIFFMDRAGVFLLEVTKCNVCVESMAQVMITDPQRLAILGGA